MFFPKFVIILRKRKEGIFLSSFKKEIFVTSSDIDFRCRMSITSIMEKFQEISGDHAKLFNVDNETLIKNYNTCWFITRIKVDVSYFPCLNDRLLIETFVAQPRRFTQDRYYIIYNENHEVVVNGVAEWCLYDIKLNKLKKFDELKNLLIDSIEFNSNLKKSLYTRLSVDVSDEDFSYEYQPRTCDIDMNMHVNNVSYGKMIINSFDCNYLSKNTLKHFEIKFVNQSFEGNIIRIFNKRITENSFYVVGRLKDTNTKLFESMLLYS